MKNIHWTPVIHIACLALSVWGIYTSSVVGNTFGVGFNAFAFGLNLAFLITWPLLQQQRMLIRSAMEGWKSCVDVLNEIRRMAEKE